MGSLALGTDRAGEHEHPGVSGYGSPTRSLFERGRVQPIPGWQARTEEYTHCRTWEWTESGTNRQELGLICGSSCDT